MRFIAPVAFDPCLDVIEVEAQMSAEAVVRDWVPMPPSGPPIDE